MQSSQGAKLSPNQKKIHFKGDFEMKKLTSVVATLALALPLAASPFAMTTTANAATVTPKATTHALTKATHFPAITMHAKAATTLNTIHFAADRAIAFVSPAKAKLSTKKTYTVTKTITLATGKHTSATYYLISEHGKALGWAKAATMIKGNAPTAKLKATKKTPKTKLTIAKKTTKKAGPKATGTKKATPKIKVPKKAIKLAKQTKAKSTKLAIKHPKASIKPTKKVTTPATKKPLAQPTKTKKMAPKLIKKTAKQHAKKAPKLATKKHLTVKATTKHTPSKLTPKAAAKIWLTTKVLSNLLLLMTASQRAVTTDRDAH